MLFYISLVTAQATLSSELLLYIPKEGRQRGPVLPVLCPYSSNQIAQARHEL